MVVTPTPGLDDFNIEDPRSVVNLCPPKMGQKILELSPHMLALSEEELVERAFGLDSDDSVIGPSPVLSKIRIAFWDEYDRAQRNGDQINIPSILRKVCRTEQFERDVLDKPYVLAWLLLPPTDYMLSLKDIHNMSLRQMRIAMNMDPAEGGKANVKLMEIQFKIAQHIDMRLKGAIVQRIDQRNVNFNVDTPASSETAQTANRVAFLTASELETKIMELERRSKQLSVPGGVIEVDLMKNVKPDTIVVDAEAKEEKT